MASFGQPTIVDVALRAGVSNMTVSRVVRGKGYVSERTRARVEAAIEELGYRPNALAKSMRTNATKHVGFILPDLTNGAYALAAQTAEGILAEHGYRMVLGSTRFSPDIEAQFISDFQRNTVDGIIAVLSDETRARTQALIQKSFVPVVLIDSDLEVPVDRVLVDGAQCVRDIVVHLVGLGHKKIALLSTPTTTRSGRLSTEAYGQALDSVRIERNSSFVRLRQPIAANGYQAALELLRLEPRPTALIVAAPQLIIGAIQAVRDTGLQIPDDLSVACSDDGLLSGLVDPPLTMISPNMQLMGTHAARLLLSRLAGTSSTPQTVTVRSELVMRKSCSQPPTHDR